MMRTEGSCSYISFRNEPFEVHSCLTYALLSRRFDRVRKVVLDRIRNIASLGLGDTDLDCIDRVLDLYEIAVLFHDVGKLLPIYPLGRESNFFGHEFFSFYILRKAFMDQEIASKLNIDSNTLRDFIHLALVPILLHHSAHRWALGGSVMRDFLLRIAAKSRHNIDVNTYIKGLMSVLERVCLCTDRLYDLCRTVMNKVCGIVHKIVIHGYKAVVKEIEYMIDSIANPYSLSSRLIGIKIHEIAIPILVAILQLSDRLAAKIIRRGAIQPIDLRAYIFFSS